MLHDDRIGGAKQPHRGDCPMTATLQRPGTMSDGDFAWDFGPPRISSTPNYRALLTELMESVGALLDGSHDETHHGTHVNLGNLQDVQSDYERISMELAGVNP